MKMVNDELYTTDDLRQILKCCRRTIYRYIEEDGLPVIRLSRQRMFVMGSDLKQWLLARKS